MLIYDNDYETKENKSWTKDKIEQESPMGILIGLSDPSHP